MRLTSLLLLLPLAFAAPSPDSFNFPGSSIAASNGAPAGSSNGLAGTFRRRINKRDAATDAIKAQLKKGRSDLEEWSRRAGADLQSVATQAGQSGNTAVGDGARGASGNLNTVLPPITAIISAVDSNRTLGTQDFDTLATAVKGIQTLEGSVTVLERAIVNKDNDLSKFIAASVSDGAVMRESVNAIMAANNLAFVNGAVQVAPPNPTNNAGYKGAAAGGFYFSFILVVSCALYSL